MWMSLENDPFDFGDEAVGRAVSEQRSHELLRQVAKTRERGGTAGVTAIEVAGHLITTAPNEANLSFTEVATSSRQERRARWSSAVPDDVRDAIASCCDHLGERGLARSSGTDDGHQSGIQGHLVDAEPISTLYSHRRDDLRRHCRRWWFGAHIDATRRIYTSLAQRVELYATLDPREPVLLRLANGVFRMSIRTVQARLEASVAPVKLRRSDAPLAEPELALSSIAAKDDMSEALNLLAYRGIGPVPQPRCAVATAASNRYKDISLRPSTLPKPVPQLIEIHLELSGTFAQRDAFVLNVGVRASAQADQIVSMYRRSYLETQRTSAETECARVHAHGRGLRG